MIMNAVLAVALGLAPVKPGVDSIRVNPADYAAMIGRYHQTTDRSGTTHLSGYDRLTGRPFAIDVAQNGHVEGTVGELFLTFDVSETA